MTTVVNAQRSPFGKLARSYTTNTYASPLARLSEATNIQLRNLGIGQNNEEKIPEAFTYDKENGAIG